MNLAGEPKRGSIEAGSWETHDEMDYPWPFSTSKGYR